MKTQASKIEWSRNLADMGTINRMARERLEEIDAAIAKHAAIIAALKADAAAIIKHHDRQVEANWSGDEIAAAKAA